MGKCSEDVMGKNIWDLYPETVGTFVYLQYHKALEEQVSLQFEFYNEILGIWFDISVYPSENGLSVFFKDITERKKTEEELRKLSLIAKETANIVIISTPDNKITWVNDAFTRITGYTYEEAKGKSPSDILDGPESDFNTIKYMNEQRQKGLAFHVEIMNYTKSGKKIWY